MAEDNLKTVLADLLKQHHTYPEEITTGSPKERNDGANAMMSKEKHEHL